MANLPNLIQAPGYAYHKNTGRKLFVCSVNEQEGTAVCSVADGTQAPPDPTTGNPTFENSTYPLAELEYANPGDPPQKKN